MITPPTVLRRLTLFIVLLLAGTGFSQEPPSSPDKKPKGAMMRLLCVQSVSGEEETVSLARKTEDGEWQMLGEMTLRSPFIGSWMRVPNGMIHIVRKAAGEPVSIGSFRIPENLKQAILILLPDRDGKSYRSQVIDPTKLGFGKGKALIVNYGNLPAIVMIGKKPSQIAPGQKVVADITADAGGMYRLLIGHRGKDNRIVPCYDRYVSSRDGTRKFILLFPDTNTGLRAMSLSEFGPFE